MKLILYTKITIKNLNYKVGPTLENNSFREKHENTRALTVQHEEHVPSHSITWIHHRRLTALIVINTILFISFISFLSYLSSL